MAQFTEVEPAALSAPTLVEGFPGVGLVGKIAVDHLVEAFGMSHHANLHCEGLPPVVGYGADDRSARTPVRLYADEERDLLALQSDVPVAPRAARSVAECLGSGLGDEVTPLYLSGIPAERAESPPAVYGTATGGLETRLADAGVEAPPEPGVVSGPTGALLARALERGDPAAGIVAESDPKFPDPASARAVLRHAVEPLAGVSVPTDDLVERASEIRKARERLAQQMQDPEADASRAQSTGMYQ
ncbi:MAG: archaeal enzymes of ATP-grasp superfamily [uncultured archaeon A07HB70]|nr:MAG: archaeal enzymes of ATP-grasp superfamily [uncultured archaeon A07HB70]